MATFTRTLSLGNGKATAAIYCDPNSQRHYRCTLHLENERKIPNGSDKYYEVSEGRIKPAWGHRCPYDRFDYQRLVFVGGAQSEGYRASLTLTPELKDGKGLQWTLELTNENKGWTASISGVAELNIPTPSRLLTANEKQHANFMLSIIDDIDRSLGTEARALGIKIMYDYLVGDALEFVRSNEKFKTVVAQKGWELKQIAPERVALCASIDRVLSALHLPLVKPLTAA